METSSQTETPPLNPEPPVRILLQALTHLVPGKDNFERTDFIIDMLCQHHWGCDFSGPRFRWKSYNDRFGLNNVRCFFLVDHGESENDKDVPILSYEWTGELLKSLPQLANDPEVMGVLEKYRPFTYRKREKKERPIKKLVKDRLYCLEPIPTHERDHMREHPEDMEWLKTHVRPRFWRTFAAEMNKKKPLGAEDIQE